MTSFRFLAVLLDCQNILWHPQNYLTDWSDNCKVYLFSDGFNRLQKCPRFGFFFFKFFFFKHFLFLKNNNNKSFSEFLFFFVP